jgi:hypothetical protein
MPCVVLWRPEPLIAGCSSLERLGIDLVQVTDRQAELAAMCAKAANGGSLANERNPEAKDEGSGSESRRSGPGWRGRPDTSAERQKRTQRGVPTSHVVSTPHIDTAENPPVQGGMGAC